MNRRRATIAVVAILAALLSVLAGGAARAATTTLTGALTVDGNQIGERSVDWDLSATLSSSTCPSVDNLALSLPASTPNVTLRPTSTNGLPTGITVSSANVAGGVLHINLSAATPQLCTSPLQVHLTGALNPTASTSNFAPTLSAYTGATLVVASAGGAVPAITWDTHCGLAPGALLIVADCFDQPNGPLEFTDTHQPWHNGLTTNAGDCAVSSNTVTAANSTSCSQGIDVPSDARVTRATVVSPTPGTGVWASTSAGNQYSLVVSPGASGYQVQVGSTVLASLTTTPQAGDVIVLTLPEPSGGSVRGTVNGTPVGAPTMQAAPGTPTAAGIAAASAGSLTNFAVTEGGTALTATWTLAASTSPTTLWVRALLPEEMTVTGISVSGLTGFSGTPAFATTTPTVTAAQGYNTPTLSAGTLSTTLGAGVGFFGHRGGTVDFSVTGITQPGTATATAPTITLTGNRVAADGTTQTGATWTGTTQNTVIAGASASCSAEAIATTPTATQPAGPEQALRGADCFARPNTTVTNGTAADIGTWAPNLKQGSSTTRTTWQINAASKLTYTGTDPVADLSMPVAGQATDATITIASATWPTKGQGIAINSDGQGNAYLAFLEADGIDLYKETGYTLTQVGTKVPFDGPTLSSGKLASNSTHTLRVEAYQPNPNAWTGTDPMTIDAYVDGYRQAEWDQLTWAGTGPVAGIAASSGTDATFQNFAARPVVAVMSWLANQYSSVAGHTDFERRLTFVENNWITGIPYGVPPGLAGEVTLNDTLPPGTWNAFGMKFNSAVRTTRGQWIDVLDYYADNSTHTSPVMFGAQNSSILPGQTGQLAAANATGYTQTAANITNEQLAWSFYDYGPLTAAITTTYASPISKIQIRLPQHVTGTPSITSASGVTGGNGTLTLNGDLLTWTAPTAQVLTTLTLNVGGLNYPDTAQLEEPTADLADANGNIVDRIATRATSAHWPEPQILHSYSSGPTATVDGGTQGTQGDTAAVYQLTFTPNIGGKLAQIYIVAPPGTTAPNGIQVQSSSGINSPVSIVMDASQGALEVQVATPIYYAAGTTFTISFTGVSMPAAWTAGWGTSDVYTLSEDAWDNLSWQPEFDMWDFVASGYIAPPPTLTSVWTLTSSLSSTRNITGQPVTLTWNLTLPPVLTTPQTVAVTLDAGYTGTGTGTITGLPGTWTARTSGATVTFTNASPVRTTANTSATITITGLTSPAAATTTSNTIALTQFGATRGTNTQTLQYIAPTVTISVGPASTAATLAPGTSPQATAPITVNASGNVANQMTLALSATTLTGSSGTIPGVTPNLSSGIATGSLPSAAYALQETQLSGFDGTLAAGLQAGKWATPTSNSSSPDTIDTASPTAAQAGVQLTLGLLERVDATIAPGNYQSTLTFTVTGS